MGCTLPMAVAFDLIANIALAHITVSPVRQSPGTKETYALNVPTEGASATKCLELDIPPDVIVLEVTAPGEQYRMVKAEGRIVGVV